MNVLNVIQNGACRREESINNQISPKVEMTKHKVGKIIREIIGK